MQVVVHNKNKALKERSLTMRQRVAIERIKRIIRMPRLEEWERQHLKALLDLPLN